MPNPDLGRSEASKSILAGVALIARCPEHGLHGERQECFVCGGPVERVPMVPLTSEARERAFDAAFDAKGGELSYTEEEWLNAALDALGSR